MQRPSLRAMTRAQRRSRRGGKATWIRGESVASLMPTGPCREFAAVRDSTKTPPSNPSQNQPTRYPMWAQPASLRSDLKQNSALVVVKGDANYRRMLGDRPWPFDAPFTSGE